MDPITFLIFMAVPLAFFLLSGFLQQRTAQQGGAAPRPRGLGDTLRALGQAGAQARDCLSALGRVDGDDKRRLLAQGVQSDPSRLGESRQALEEYLRLPNRAAERAAAYLLLGNRHYESGGLAEAERSYRQAIAAAEEAEEPRVKSTALGNLGLLLVAENPQRARQSLEEALALDRGLGNRMGVVNHLAALARLYQAQGDSARALTVAQQAVEGEEDLNASRHWADALGNLALVYRAQRQLADARVCLEQALQIERDIGSLAGEAACLDNLGFIYQEQGDLARALDLHQQARTLFEYAGAHAQAEAARQRVATVKRQLEAPSS